MTTYGDTMCCNAELLSLFFTFFVMALGSVPNCGASGGRSTGLFISDGTDSVLRILATTTEIGNVTMYVHGRMKNTLCVSTADWGLNKTYLVERRFCRMELPLCTCCGTLTCTESRQHMRDPVAISTWHIEALFKSRSRSIQGLRFSSSQITCAPMAEKSNPDRAFSCYC